MICELHLNNGATKENKMNNSSNKGKLPRFAFVNRESK